MELVTFASLSFEDMYACLWWFMDPNVDKSLTVSIFNTAPSRKTDLCSAIQVYNAHLHAINSKMPLFCNHYFPQSLGMHDIYCCSYCAELADYPMFVEKASQEFADVYKKYQELYPLWSWLEWDEMITMQEHVYEWDKMDLGPKLSYEEKWGLTRSEE